MAVVESKISDFKNNEDNYPEPIELLHVPDVVWKIKHQFTELMGRQFKNSSMKQQSIDIALLPCLLLR